MNQVRLLIDIEAEGIFVPAGTICEVEKYYPPSFNPRTHERQHGCYDLIIGDAKKPHAIFWVNACEVTPL